VSNDFPEMRREAQAAQADPRYPGCVDDAEDVLDCTLVIGLPTFIMKQRIEVEADPIAPVLTAARRSQPFIEAGGFQLFFAGNASRINRPGDTVWPMIETLRF
jgi:hypothetical protein